MQHEMFVDKKEWAAIRGLGRSPIIECRPGWIPWEGDDLHLVERDPGGVFSGWWMRAKIIRREALPGNRWKLWLNQVKVAKQ